MSDKTDKLPTLEKTCFFLGRFLAKEVDGNVTKLRSLIRHEHGVKTRVSVGADGLRSGTRSTSALYSKRKQQQETIPLERIVLLKQDEKCRHVVLVTLRLAPMQYEIVAFRCKDKTDAEMLERTFLQIRASLKAERKPGIGQYRSKLLTQDYADLSPFSQHVWSRPELGGSSNVPRSVFPQQQRRALKSPDKTTSRILEEIDEDFRFLRVNDDVRECSFAPVMTSTEKRAGSEADAGAIDSNFQLRKATKSQSQRAASTQTPDDPSLDLLPLDSHPNMTSTRVLRVEVKGVDVCDVSCQVDTCASAVSVRQHVKDRFLSASQPSLLSLDDVIYDQALSTSCDNLLEASTQKNTESKVGAKKEPRQACTIATQTSFMATDDVIDARSARIESSDSIRRQVSELSAEVQRLKKLVQLNKTPDDDVTVREAPIGARIVRSITPTPRDLARTTSTEAVEELCAQISFGDWSDDSFYTSQPLQSSTPRGAVALRRTGSFRRARPSPEGSVSTGQGRQRESIVVQKGQLRMEQQLRPSNAVIDELKRHQEAKALIKVAPTKNIDSSRKTRVATSTTPHFEEKSCLMQKPPTKPGVRFTQDRPSRPVTRIPIRNRSSLYRVASHEGTRDSRGDDATSAHLQGQRMSRESQRQAVIKQEIFGENRETTNRAGVLQGSTFETARLDSGQQTRAKLIMNPRLKETFSSDL